MRLLPLVALALSTSLAAQQPDSGRRGMPMRMGPGMEGMMGHMGQMMGPMMRIMVESPEHLLMHRDVLGLTDQQVAKLTALRDAAKSAEEAAHRDVATHGQALATVFATASADTGQLKAHFQAMQAAMANGHWAALSAAAQARSVLTETQRARADGWGDALEQMVPGMMGRGMRRDSTHH